MQSYEVRQPELSTHFFWSAHHPPQSTPVSFAFLTPSLQVGTAIDKLMFFIL